MLIVLRTSGAARGKNMSMREPVLAPPHREVDQGRCGGEACHDDEVVDLSDAERRKIALHTRTPHTRDTPACTHTQRRRNP